MCFTVHVTGTVLGNWYNGVGSGGELENWSIGALLNWRTVELTKLRTAGL